MLQTFKHPGEQPAILETQAGGQSTADQLVTRTLRAEDWRVLRLWKATN